MAQIRLHDSRTGALVPLRPRDGRRVGIYACGPTVYGRIHVGNARSFAVFSVLRRALAREGLEVVHVSNVTDINDKIYVAAREAGVPSAELAREMTAAYVADTDALGLGRPDHEPLATQYVDEIVAEIEVLIARGHAYEAGGDVYFAVRSDAQYGSLSHRSVDDMDQGEETDAARPPLKRDPLDFALWKARKPDEDTWWPSPWGDGRPGWHIECSAMAAALLGTEFEVHGGGNDLTFPHHENEAAQTRCAHGTELAQVWVHNGMLTLGGKMSKSVGNIVPLHEALAEHGRDALVMLYASAHYRQPLAYGEDTLAEAAARVRRIREAGRRLVPGPSPADMRVHADAFFAALREDFDTPGALGHLFTWVREANRREGAGDEDLRAMLDVLGLAGLLDAEHGGPPPGAVALLERREAARAARDFAAADRLRDELRAQGWEVRDGPAGPELVRA